MNHDSLPSPSGHAVEGIARVVSIGAGEIWLEPEQTSSCGHCASSASCGASAREAAGIGTITSRLQARRFRLDHAGTPADLQEGDRLVVGVSEGALLRASLTAYGVPLLCALVSGSLAQAAYGQDATTLLGMLAGLAAGLLLARLNARRLASRGDLAPRFLRRARADETCATV